MFDLSRMFIGQSVEFDGKKYITLYFINAKDGWSHYIACEAEATLPAPTFVIRVRDEVMSKPEAQP